MSSAEQRRKQVKHFDGEGCARALTFSCYQRRPMFNRDISCKWMIDALERGRQRHPVHLWAFVVMPEHVHALVWPTDHDFKIQHFLSTVKQSVSKRARIDHLRSGGDSMAEVKFHFWQDGPGYDRNLWNARTVWETIDYIHANPVRRNLCQCSSEWRWSSAAEYQSALNVLLPVDKSSLPEDPR